MNLSDSPQSRDMHLTEEEFQALSPEDQESYLNLLQEEITFRKTRKLLYYEPYDKQLAFHQSPCHIRAMFGGNRSGKTTAGGMEFLFHITGLYPKWYPEDKRFDGPVKGRIVVSDFQKGTGEVIIPFLEEWLDMSLVKRKYRNPIGIATKWELKNGSVFDILTHEQTTMQFEGWKGHVVWFDEPPPRDKYIATLRGLVDYRGRAWLTLTPLTQPWIFDEIYSKNDGKSIFAVTCDMRDNPHITEEAIKEYEDKMTEEEKDARMHGKFMHLTGLIYKEFNANVNICEPPKVQKHWTRYFCIDPHPRMPTACLWLAVDPDDNHWIYDELWLEGMDVEQICHAIHVQEGDLPPLLRFIDPAMDKDNELAGGFNMRKELMKHGVYCNRANTDPHVGMNRIKMALKPKYLKTISTEVPQLRVSRHCRQVIYEFNHYIWSDRLRNKESFDAREKPMKKSDHFMDCLRYLYNYGLRYIPPEDKEENDSITYTGEYTKYPSRVPDTGYHSLVEGK